MKIQVNFKVIDPDYSQEYADEYNFGKESESNWRYNWSSGYELLESKSVELISNGNYLLEGRFKNGIDFSYSIPNICIFRCHLKNGNVVDFGVSKSILKKTHQVTHEKSKTTRCYFYIKAEPISIELGNHLVINVEEIPEEFIKINNEHTQL